MKYTVVIFVLAPGNKLFLNARSFLRMGYIKTKTKLNPMGPAVGLTECRKSG